MSYNAPPPPNPYGQPQYGGAPQGNNKKAIWSLVTGIAGLCCCQPVGIVAILLSRNAKDEIGRTGQSGQGMATAGFVLGVIALVLLVVNIILFSTGVLTFDFDAYSN